MDTTGTVVEPSPPMAIDRTDVAVWNAAGLAPYVAIRPEDAAKLALRRTRRAMRRAGRRR